MNIEEEIIARLRAAKLWDKDAQLSDFQIVATENGSVLINLRTKRAHLIYDEFSELHDLEQLFPEVTFLGFPRRKPGTPDAE